MDNYNTHIISWDATSTLSFVQDVVYKNGQFAIIQKGYYYIYSQVTFKESNITENPYTSLLHSIFKIKTNGNSEYTEKLLESSQSKCQLQSQTSNSKSYIGDVFYLQENDNLQVRVTRVSKSGKVKITTVKRFGGIDKLRMPKKHEHRNKAFSKRKDTLLLKAGNVYKWQSPLHPQDKTLEEESCRTQETGNQRQDEPQFPLISAPTKKDYGSQTTLSYLNTQTTDDDKCKICGEGELLEKALWVGCSMDTCAYWVHCKCVGICAKTKPDGRHFFTFRFRFSTTKSPPSPLEIFPLTENVAFSCKKSLTGAGDCSLTTLSRSNHLIQKSFWYNIPKLTESSNMALVVVRPIAMDNLVSFSSPRKPPSIAFITSSKKSSICNFFLAEHFSWPSATETHAVHKNVE
ncbi:hypothetical protein KUTeg_011608 [Tegillarca granosa]|uniref:THD domain-containing protein n=1 Tax=Tegillarca granosa TaxID=220873 RepID=A0ABQ9EX39_TEGGR|nr:hypothetical protein KUTeg_011608 [Tegillarca granosa]